MKAFPTAAVALLIAAWPVPIATCEESEAQRAFEKAYFKENAERDLAGALKEYRLIIEKHEDERTTVAKAWLRIGLCLEKLGKKEEAVEALSRALSAYKDVAAIREEAQAALKRLKGVAQEEVKVKKTSSAQILAALDKKVSIEVVEATLSDVTHIMSELGGVNIVADQRLADEDDSGGIMVSLSVSDIDLKSALKLVTSLKGLAWDVMHGAILVSRPEYIAEYRTLEWFGDGREGADESVQAILKTLRSRTLSADFQDTPIQVVMRYLWSVSELNFILVPAEGTSKIPDSMVTIKVVDSTLETALRLILMPHNLEYRVEDEIVKISARKKALGPGLMNSPDGRAGGGAKPPDGKDRTHLAEAVSMGLEWLAAHQGADGMWSSSGFNANCRAAKCGGEGDKESDLGVTGLATLAFLGRGMTHKDGAYAGVVSKALMAMMLKQDTDGCIGMRTGAGRWIYGHSICALALAECTGLTGDEGMIRNAAQKAVDFLAVCQNPGKGWRYGVKPGDNDSSCTAWAVMAMKSASIAGLKVPSGALDSARAWYESVTDSETGSAGYMTRGDSGARPAERVNYPPQEAMTAASVFCRILCGEAVDAPQILLGAKRISRCLPEYNVKERKIDMYYWYFGTLAMSSLGGKQWESWASAMKAALIPSQIRMACARGSWDPECVWGISGGRVYSTALCTLMCEVLARTVQGK